MYLVPEAKVIKREVIKPYESFVWNKDWFNFQQKISKNRHSGGGRNPGKVILKVVNLVNIM
jgi:hypothetical protein